MKIGFDARMILHSGIGTYIRGLLDVVVQKSEYDWTLFGPLEKLTDYPCRKVLADAPIYSIREQLFMPTILKRHPADLFHFPHYNVPLGFKGNCVITIHDLIHLRFPKTTLAYFYARTLFESATRKARRIIVDSLHTKKDLMQLLGVDENKIRVVYPGMGNELVRLSETPRTGIAREPETLPFGLEPDYLLYVGNVRPTKNIPLLIEAFFLAKEKIKNLRLVVAGKNSMPELARRFEKNAEVRFIGEVPLRHLPNLYRGARIFVFPSLYEGFGLPPLEAMSLGVPVISSNAASLPEAVGDAALMFDPKNASQLAEKICALWPDEQMRKELAAKGREQAAKFSWKKCAEETLRVYEECLSISPTPH